MSLTRLQEDLLQDFKEQKTFIHEQVLLFTPMAASLQKPAASRLVSKGSLILCEIFCYTLCAGTVVFAVMMQKIYPFTTLADMLYDTQTRMTLGFRNVLMLTGGVYSIAGLCALLFYIIARTMRAIRLKNDILHEAGRDMKGLVGKLLRRKAEIEAIEQRHFTELPDMTLTNRTDTNEVLNPGYEG
ncbi:MAG: hypothetical protein H0X33_10745 [Taibaiella sp.]|nr:hypothetical protein [Taibaiella sp.]